ELADFPNTRSAFAERTVGGYFLDFVVNREAAARYGLKVGDVNDIIESAIGGKNITTTVEGRERYSINARYARDFRQDIDALKRVIPFTLLIIFMLIYISTRSVTKTAIVLLAVPFSLIGAFWLLYLLGYNMSVAVWVGLIALAGLDAETGVVMLLYLDHAWEK